MDNHMLAPYFDLYRFWAETTSDLVMNQWKLAAAPYEAGYQMLEALAGSGAEQAAKIATTDPTAAPMPLAGLEQLALERAAKGVPLPREVYEVQNRSRINWAQFPSWARPSDPQLFEGCVHEG